MIPRITNIPLDNFRSSHNLNLEVQLLASMLRKINPYSLRSNWISEGNNKICISGGASTIIERE